jgi:fructoselysine-6-P-deglycase FrlB-like protein
MGYTGTGLWADVQEVPGALTATLAAADGVAEAAALLRDGSVERVVAVGNGASYYVALALWLASLESSGGDDAPALHAVPCGVAGERFRWRAGDAVLAISSSGEFRDVVEIARAGQVPCVAITADPDSTLARFSHAIVLQHVESQRAVTHTQALCGAYAVALALWAAVVGDEELAAVAADAPEAASRAIAAAESWAPEALADRTPPAAAVAAGGGTAWAAALELALMLKEIARVPAEGVETREGATSAMFGLDRGHLMVSLDPPGDPLGDEALALCAATGADTLQLPSVADVDLRLAPIAALPASAALATHLALVAGHDVDHPTWTNAYHATARSEP